tara:strand:+ start:68 stop:787 length:720 start_codon:yes stop_codon:yes gene_type:complete
MKLRRQEFKYFISNKEILFLRNSLKKFMLLDNNADKNKFYYTVSSLYFETPYSDHFNEKVDGIINREKFRIRKYSSSNIIKFESKKKIENVIEKNSSIIDNKNAQNLIKGNFNELNDYNLDFLKEAYIKLKLNSLRVKNIVEYDREAYYLPYGNIRITFDMNLRTYNSEINFLNIKNSSVPIFHDKLNILEIKSGLPLPEHLKIILKNVIASRSAISKFVFGQKYINFSRWQDKVQEPF